MNKQDEEVDKYYPDRILIDYYCKLINNLKFRIDLYEAKVLQAYGRIKGRAYNGN